MYSVSKYCRFSFACIRNECLYQCIWVSPGFLTVTIFNTKKQFGCTVHSKVFGVKVITVAIETSVWLGLLQGATLMEDNGLKGYIC